MKKKGHRKGRKSFGYARAGWNRKFLNLKRALAEVIKILDGGDNK